MKYEKILRNIVLGAIFLIPLVPTVVCSSLFFPYITGKAFIFRILVEIAFFLWVVLAIGNKKYRVQGSAILYGILALVGVMFFADLLGANPLKSFWSNFERMEGWVTLLHLLTYFLVLAGILKTQKLWNYFINTSLVVSVWMSFYGIFQMLGWAEAVQGTSRLDVSLGNASYLAIYAVFHIFLALFMWVRREKKNDFVGWFYGGTFFLNIFILYHTATRGAILGFVGALFLISLLVTFFEKENKNIRKIGAIFLVGTIVLVGSFFAVKDTFFVRNNQVLNRFASISMEEGTTKARFLVWNMAWEGFKEKPILGWGQENFNYVFNTHYVPEMYGQEEWFDRTHNVFLDWLIAGGFLGLLIYLSLFFFVLYYLWFSKRKVDFSLLEKSIFTGLLAGYFVHNIFVFDNLTSYILFFAVLAFVHSNLSEKNESKISLLDKISQEDLKTVFLPSAMILLAFSLYFFNFNLLMANRFLLSGISQSDSLENNLNYFKKGLSYDSAANQEIREQLVQFVLRVQGINGLNEKTKEDFFVLAKEEMEKQITRDPQNARTEMFLGSFLGQFGQTEEALSHMERAKELSPNKPSFDFEIGAIYLNAKENQRAVDFLKGTYEKYPQNPKTKTMYALALIYAGQSDLADEVLTPEYKDGIVASSDFLNAYRLTGENNKMILVAEALAIKNPQDPQTHITLAAAYYEIKQNEKAIQELKIAMTLDPNFTTQGEQIIRAIQAGTLIR
ncbi:MAG: O-antigen ligase family protein [Patescibacteria group bacterium]